MQRPDVGPDDFVPLTGFEYAWRWTDARYALFSAADLECIEPLNPRAAQRIARLIESLVSTHGLAADRFGEVTHVDASGEVEPVSRWLQACVPDYAGRVLLVWWQSGHVARVPWELFTRRWNDFCYPSSDDVGIYPEIGGWMLQYGHHEELWFGEERLEDTP